MRISVTKEQLSAALRKVMSAVSSRPVIPVLNNVLVEAKEEKLILTASDLDITIRCHIPALIEQPGIITIPGKMFSQIVASLPSGDVSLVSDESLHTTISCGKSYYKLAGMEWSDFPLDNEFEETWNFSISAFAFRKSLSKVSYSRSVEESRKVLNGILLSVRNGNLTFAATDGRRLALIEQALENGENLPDGDVILPPKAVNELERIFDRDEKLVVRISESRVSFESGNVFVTSKVVEGTYPNFRQVIPASFSRQAVMPREVFATVLARVAIVVHGTSNAVALALKPAEMIVSASSPENGESHEPVDISYDGTPVAISFNPDFLAAPLKNLECEHLTIQFNDEFSPIAISGDAGFFYVIMPMRH